MKTTLKTFISIVIFISIISCGKQKKSNQSFSDFKNFVTAHADSIENYYEGDFKEMQEEYHARKTQAENNKDDWSDEMKAEYLELQMDWESFREDYLAEKARREELLNVGIYKVTNILPEGLDEGLSNVNSKNILEVYMHLVAYIENNRKDLTIEQWNQIDILWERLGVRFNHVKKQLGGSTIAAIEEQKIRYDILRAMNMPVATMETGDEVISDK